MLTDETQPTYKTTARKTPKPYLMGVDPDCDKSGVAIWSRLTGGYLLLQTMDFAGFINTLTYYHPDELLVIIERGMENPGFHHYDSLPKNFHTWTQKAQWGYMWKIGAQTGRNFGAGEYFKHFCIANGYEVEDYVPTTKKWDQAYFSMITGVKTKTNQEVRDAVRCIHGR